MRIRLLEERINGIMLVRGQRQGRKIKKKERYHMIINYSDQEVIKNQKSIFLAGPTPRGEGVDSWRTMACEKLQEFGFEGVVYVPEYSTWKPKADYVDQAMWEREALISSTVILFWIPRSLPDMPAFTTNVEFGYWLHTGKVLYGRPDSASKIKYLDWLYEEDYGKSQEILPVEKRKILK